MYIYILLLFLCIYIYIIDKNIYNNINIYNINKNNIKNEIYNESKLDIIIVYDNINISHINTKKFYVHKLNNIVIYSKMKLLFNILYNKYNKFLSIISYKNFYIYIINNEPLINNYYPNSIYISMDSNHDIYRYLNKISDSIYINHNLKYNINHDKIINIYTKY